MLINEDISKILSWNRLNSLLILAATILVFILQSTLPLALISIVSFAYYFFDNKDVLKHLKPIGGYANWVTGFRLCLLIFAIINWLYISNILSFTILLTIVILDGVDGWMARKNQQATVFGQYFDMELDALFVLFCCILLYLKDISGIWILIPGILRYVFVIYTWIIGPKEQNEKRTMLGASIAVIFFISLLISVLFQHVLQDLLLKLSSVLIVISFSISFYKYHYL